MTPAAGSPTMSPSDGPMEGRETRRDVDTWCSAGRAGASFATSTGSASTCSRRCRRSRGPTSTGRRPGWRSSSTSSTTAASPRTSTPRCWSWSPTRPSRPSWPVQHRDQRPAPGDRRGRPVRVRAGGAGEPELRGRAGPHRWRLGHDRNSADAHAAARAHRRDEHEPALRGAQRPDLRRARRGRRAGHRRRRTAEHLRRLDHPEPAYTSFQLHLQISPAQFAQYWNAAQTIAGVQLAAAIRSALTVNSERRWSSSGRTSIGCSARSRHSPPPSAAAESGWTGSRVGVERRLSWCDVVPVIGVLALQGDVREHLAALAACGVRAVPVRRPAELDAVDALVIPGGESTTIAGCWRPSSCSTRCRPGWRRACPPTARVRG